MPNTPNAKTVYFPAGTGKLFEKFSPKEVYILCTEGRELFELMRLTPEAEQYLNYKPKLKAVIEKW
jgi:hypothetical protein